MEQRRKVFKPSPFRKGTKSYTDNNYNRPNLIANSGSKSTRALNIGLNDTAKELSVGVEWAPFIQKFSS